jgi:hypothetical protein
MTFETLEIIFFLFIAGGFLALIPYMIKGEQSFDFIDSSKEGPDLPGCIGVFIGGALAYGTAMVFIFLLWSF